MGTYCCCSCCGSVSCFFSECETTAWASVGSRYLHIICFFRSCLQNGKTKKNPKVHRLGCHIADRLTSAKKFKVYVWAARTEKKNQGVLWWWNLCHVHQSIVWDSAADANNLKWQKSADQLFWFIFTFSIMVLYLCTMCLFPSVSITFYHILIQMK